jgi:hypothetical protein
VGARVVGVQTESDARDVAPCRDECLGRVHERRSDPSAPKPGKHVQVLDLRDARLPKRDIAAVLRRRWPARRRGSLVPGTRGWF